MKNVLIAIAIAALPVFAQDAPAPCQKPEGAKCCMKGKFHRPDMRAKFMEKFDADKDGQLNDQEKAAVKADMDARKAAFEKMLLEKFDANKDGQLDDQEKAAMKADWESRHGKKCCGKRHGRHHGKDMRAKFMEKFDANKDGQLDEQEKAAVKADMDAHKAAFEKMLLEKFDANKDGQLDDQEKAAMKADWEARKAERPGKKGCGKFHGKRHGHGKFHGKDMHAKFMEKFDANKDGQLDEQEKAAVKADMEARKAEFRKKFMEKFDANKDGQLDDQEKAAIKADMEARKGGPRHHGPRHGKKCCDCGCKKG